MLAFCRAEAKIEVARMWRDACFVDALGVEVVARPSIVQRLDYHACPNGIQLDVAIAGQQVAVIVDQR